MKKAWLAVVAGTACVMAMSAIAQPPKETPKVPDTKEIEKKIGDAKKDAEKALHDAAGQPGDMQMPPEMMAGPHHKHLEQFAGKWNAEVKWWMAPGTDPTVSKGTMVSEMVWEGRFLKSTFAGDMMGQPFSGESVWGYNGFKKQYESTWRDSTNTSLDYSTGSCDKDGKVFTMKGESINPMNGEKMKLREVFTIVNADTHTMDYYVTGADGKEWKSMVITYNRAK